MKYTTSFIIFLAFLISACNNSKPESDQLPTLSISENGRYMVTESGDPFFWLGDTGWLLFKKLTREESVQYLEDRKSKGFNVIQVMVIHALNSPVNTYGDSAFINMDLKQPLVTPGYDFENADQYDYWDHIEYVIKMAEERGIYMALVPIWGSNVKAFPLTSADGAYYGKWLAERYSSYNNIIWLNGGDVFGTDSMDFWKALGNGLNDNDEKHLITFHPRGRTQSSTWFHNEPWLDFNMIQSGHRRYDQDDTEKCFGEDNWRYIEEDYNLIPVKPTIDGEPSYEHIPQGLHDPKEPLWTDDDVRRYAYWSVFAGAFGFTYGHNEIMQFYREGDPASYGGFQTWQEAMDAPGATQMIHLKDLMLSRPYLERVPDQAIISGDPGIQYSRLLATRGVRYAFIYTYTGKEIKVNMGRIAGEKVSASWFNPRNGSYTEIGEFENNGVKTFNPPGEEKEGNDWVLVLDSK